MKHHIGTFYQSDDHDNHVDDENHDGDYATDDYGNHDNDFAKVDDGDSNDSKNAGLPTGRSML